MNNLIPTEHWEYTIRDLLFSRASGRSNELDRIDLPGIGGCVPLRSGRAGVVLALKALALPPGSSVAVPLYCCPVVFKAIAAAGLRPIFIDVDLASYCISPEDLSAKRSQVDAIIAVHMFGNLCDVGLLRDAAPGKPVIEDCAQALGSKLNEALAGSKGDISIFSFRSGKYLSVGEGGAIWCKDSKVALRLRELLTAVPAHSRSAEYSHATKTYLRSILRRRPFWGLIGDWLWAAYNAKTDIADQAPISVTKVFATDLNLTMRRMPQLGSWIEKQRANARCYEENLRVNAEMLCFEKPGAYWNRLQYPLLMPTPSHCEEFVKLLKRKQISTSRPYKDVTKIATQQYGYTGDCARAERVAESVLVIPCNYKLTASNRDWITESVNWAWKQVEDLPADFERGCLDAHNHITQRLQ
jgi:perosamine synthetase